MEEPDGDRPFNPPGMRTVPPILRTKGLTVLDVGQTPGGTPYMLLGSKKGNIREVSIYLKSDRPGRWLYGYTIYDQSTRTEVTYHGHHGDPTKDQLGPIEGV